MMMMNDNLLLNIHHHAVRFYKRFPKGGSKCEEPSSSAEIDYVIQQGNQVVPIEVKSGATGGFKSLHVFMGLKKPPLTV